MYGSGQYIMTTQQTPLRDDKNVYESKSSFIDRLCRYNDRIEHVKNGSADSNKYNRSQSYFDQQN